MRITPLVQRQVEEREEPIRAKGQEGSGTPSLSSAAESSILSQRGAGSPLSTGERSFFEPRFGRDFSQVRLHMDSQSGRLAQTVQARAFTFGRDIFFGQGEYRSGSSEGRGLLAHELMHVMQQTDGQTDRGLQRWKIKGGGDCLSEGVGRARSLLTGKRKEAETAYGRWGCKLDDFIDDGRGPELEIKYGGTACAVSWKGSTGDDLISINPGLIDCCRDCPDRSPVVDVIAYTIIHETAHWCAATHNRSGTVEEGDHVETALFGGIHMLEDCSIKKVSTYGDKPCFTCPYVVQKRDTLWGIAEKRYGDGSKWKRIYEANKERIGDNPDLIKPGMPLRIPLVSVKR